MNHLIANIIISNPWSAYKDAEGISSGADGGLFKLFILFSILFAWGLIADWWDKKK